MAFRTNINRMPLSWLFGSRGQHFDINWIDRFTDPNYSSTHGELSFSALFFPHSHIPHFGQQFQTFRKYQHQRISLCLAHHDEAILDPNSRFDVLS